MVLKLKVPEGVELQNFEPLLPPLLTYLFSFIYVKIYWNDIESQSTKKEY